MAKKNAPQANKANTVNTNQGSSMAAATAAPQASNGATRTATLKKVSTQKNGLTTYTEEGVGASVYINRTVFKGDAPDTIQIVAVNLTKPGENVRIGGGRKADPVKLQAKLVKSQERQAKIAARDAKLAARLKAAGIDVPMSVTVAAQQTAPSADDSTESAS
jgi:hypothetical protein